MEKRARDVRSLRNLSISPRMVRISMVFSRTVKIVGTTIGGKLMILLRLVGIRFEKIMR